MRPLAILLVEDNPGDIFMVQKALAICAIPVALTVAEDGEKALALLRKEEGKPDLVILDLNLPKLSGLAVLEQFQSKDKPPIVVFSSIRHNRHLLDRY